jgi:hypothetical protein
VSNGNQYALQVFLSSDFGISYENQALMEKHIANETVQKLIKDSKGLVKETKIIYTENQVATGFSSRL